MNHSSMVEAILDHFDRATPGQCEAGAQWYHLAYMQCNRIAVSGGIGVWEAAGIVAHLSPRTSWSTNLSRAMDMVLYGTCTGFQRARNKAWRAMKGDVRFGLDAHKTRAFHANIMGNTNMVTVDIWAARVAGVPDADLSSGKVYARVEAAYCEAAMMRCVKPSTMQAVTWVVARGKAN